MASHPRKSLKVRHTLLFQASSCRETRHGHPRSSTTLPSSYARLKLTDAAKGRAREHYIRESWVKMMEARIVREELAKCYAHEGVNRIENCKELAEQYFPMIRENQVSQSLRICLSCRVSKTIIWYP